MDTNELVIDYNYKKIKENFDIFKFELDISYGDKFKVYNSRVLDKPVLDLKAKSLVYEKGNSFYVLYDKGKITREKLIEELKKEKYAEKISVELISPRKIEPQYLLFQLFLNALGNYKSKKYAFNNLTGKLIYYKKSDIEKKYDKNILWSIQTYNIRVKKGNVLSISVSKANSIKLKNKMEFENYKNKFEDYPQYQIGVNKTLKRAEKINDWDNNYIFKSVNNKKASSKFLDFTTSDKFQISKLGVLYIVLSNFRERFSEYVTFDFKNYKTDIDTKINGSDFKNNVNNKVLEKGICLINKSTSDFPEVYFDELKERIKAINPNYEVTIVNDRIKDKLNIVLVHNKNFYEKFNIKDQYYKFLDGISTQHITIEDFEWYLNKQYPNKDLALEVVLKELVIKQDLIDRKISIVDWKNFNYNDDWIFGVITEDENYYFMKIRCNGEFEVRCIRKEDFNYGEYNKYISHFLKYNGIDNLEFEDSKEEKSFDTSIVGLVKDCNENINLIKETNLFAMPKFETIGKIIDNINDTSVEFNKIDIINILDELIERNGEELFSEIKEKIIVKTTCTKGDIFDVTKNVLMNNKVNRSLNLRRTTFFKKIYEKTGEIMGLYIRNAKDKAEILSNALDIKYMKLSDKYESAYYSVGLNSSNVRGIFPNSTRIREVVAEIETDSELIFHKLIPLMDVEFVRYGQPTVIPFPFKYLREFMKQGIRLDEF